MDFPFAIILNDDLNRRNTAYFFGRRLNPEEYIVWGGKKKKEKLIWTSNIKRKSLVLKKQLKPKRNFKIQHSDA